MVNVNELYIVKPSRDHADSEYATSVGQTIREPSLLVTNKHTDTQLDYQGST